MDVKALIQNKGTGYWLCAAASACALVVGIIVLATQGMALTVDVAGQGWTVSVMLFIGFAVTMFFDAFGLTNDTTDTVVVVILATGAALTLFAGICYAAFVAKLKKSQQGGSF